MTVKGYFLQNIKKSAKKKMPKYVISLTKRAQKQLDKLSDKVAEPILESIDGLADNPRPPGYIKLKNRQGYRIRVGDYRVIYEIFDNILTVDIITIGNRKDVYG